LIVIGSPPSGIGVDYPWAACRPARLEGDPVTMVEMGKLAGQTAMLKSEGMSKRPKAGLWLVVDGVQQESVKGVLAYSVVDRGAARRRRI
jgi:hypothetical protein